MSSTIDKNKLAQKIKALDGLTSDEKSALIGLLNTRKKYGLVWEEKQEDVEELLREKLPVFTEVKERRIDAQPQEKEEGKLNLFGNDEKDSAPPPDHIIIEGDNLHALTALLYTHEGKIDVIDIDPPYNTGNKDFVYNDSYVDKEDAWRHSKWLCFMSKRLKLAKMLLKESGVIFIHIDDNEQAQLKLLCDEIFGIENVLCQFSWRTDGNFDNQAKVKICHEYIIAYQRDPAYFQRPAVIDPTISSTSKLFNGEIRNTIVKNGPKNPISTINLPQGFPSDLHEGIIKKRNTGWPHYLSDVEIRNGKTVNSVIVESGWSSKSLLEEFIKTNFNSVFDTKGQKTRFTISKSGAIEAVKDRSENQSHIISVLNGFGGTQKATAMLNEMDIFFKQGYPKPLELIKYFIQMCNLKSATILDFFAGSGTTLHATMALNAEDKGRRQCILVTNNENNICEEVTYERNKRVIQGYTKQNGEKVPGLTNNNLRYYKTDFVDREPTMKNRKALTRAAVDLLCIRENCYNPHPTLDTKEIRVFTSQTCELVIIFDPDYIEAALPVIDTLYPGKVKLGSKPRCKVYVFSPGHYAFDDEFEPVQGKIELCALPEAIYRAYKAVLPKAKQRILEELENAEGQTHA